MDHDWEDADWDADGDWDVVGDAPVIADAPGRSGLTAVQMGTAAAVAGHLLDRHAERIVAALGGGSRPRRAAPPPAGPTATAPRGPRIDWSAPPLVPGAGLSRSRLATTIAVHLGARRPLRLVADSDEGLSFTVSVHADGRPAPVEVVFALGGFDGDRLRPVAAVPAAGGTATAALSDPAAAVDIVTWAVERHDSSLASFRWRAGGA